MRLARLRPALAALLFAVAAAAGITWSPAAAISGGVAESWASHPWMVQIQQNRGVAWFTDCSGTLIGPTHVLTAAHCTEVYPGVGGPLQPNDPALRYRVLLADGQAVIPVHAFFPTGFDYDSGRGDLAVLQLPNATSLPPVRLVMRNPATTAAGSGLGFGCAEFDSNACVAAIVQGALGTPTGGLGRLRSDQEGVLMSGGVPTNPIGGAVCATPVWQICTLDRTGITRDGDSGGPFMVQTDQGPAEVGVLHDQANTKAATDNNVADLTSTWTALASECAFLHQFVGR